ncbi:MAG TPA: DUF4287 domain-containing protein [Caulobacteraceae bacterium]|nr:DUF4287 domain-containing protein [Caulobacteraceae bacterium]
MASVEQGLATLDRNIEAKTGRPVTAWVALAHAEGFEKHGALVNWLKAAHGLSHSHANQIAKRAFAPPVSSDPVARLFTGAKASLRPLYDMVVAAATALGPDVEVAPKKANVSLRRRKQFGLLQPSTRTRLDLGLILAGRPPQGRLEPSGSFHAMFSHRVRLEQASDVDDAVRAWLREAYEAAG